MSTLEECKLESCLDELIGADFWYLRKNDEILFDSYEWHESTCENSKCMWYDQPRYSCNRDHYLSCTECLKAYDTLQTRRYALINDHDLVYSIFDGDEVYIKLGWTGEFRDISFKMVDGILNKTEFYYPSHPIFYDRPKHPKRRKKE